MKRALLSLIFVALTANAGATVRPEIAQLPRTTVTVGGGPDWMTTGGNAVWIGNIDLQEVERVDATTNTVIARIKVSGVPCSGISYGFASVWVPICEHRQGRRLVRIDARTNRVSATLQIVPADSEGGIATSLDSVWIAIGTGVLARIDPATNSIRQRISVASGSQNPVYADGKIWITSSDRDILTAVDAYSGRTVARIAIPAQPHFLTAGAGAVWTIDQGSGSITKVDARSKRVVATIRAKIPGSGGTVALGAGFIWATIYGTPLTKIDATTNVLLKQWYGPGGDALTFGYGSLWLANHHAGIVWRIDPRATGSASIGN
jgi:virginiamycin B lyase